MPQEMHTLFDSGTRRGAAQRIAVRPVADNHQMRIGARAGRERLHQLDRALAGDEPADRGHDEAVGCYAEPFAGAPAIRRRRSLDAERDEFHGPRHAIDVGDMAYRVAGLADHLIRGIQQVADRRAQPGMPMRRACLLGSKRSPPCTDSTFGIPAARASRCPTGPEGTTK